MKSHHQLDISTSRNCAIGSSVLGNTKNCNKLPTTYVVRRKNNNSIPSHRVIEYWTTDSLKNSYWNGRGGKAMYLIMPTRNNSSKCSLGWCCTRYLSTFIPSRYVIPSCTEIGIESGTGAFKWRVRFSEVGSIYYRLITMMYLRRVAFTVLVVELFVFA